MKHWAWCCDVVSVWLIVRRAYHGCGRRKAVNPISFLVKACHLGALGLYSMSIIAISDPLSSKSTCCHSLLHRWHRIPREQTSWWLVRFGYYPNRTDMGARTYCGPVSILFRGIVQPPGAELKSCLQMRCTLISHAVAFRGVFISVVCVGRSVSSCNTSGAYWLASLLGICGGPSEGVCPMLSSQQFRNKNQKSSMNF